RLPLEIGVAGTIALAILGYYVTGLVVSKPQAARFLDRSLGAKDRFLTLSTIERAPSVLTVVESSAAAIAASVRDLPLPPRRKRQISSAGSAGGASEKRDQGRQQKADGNRQEQGASEQASGQGKEQQAGGTGNGEGNARGQAKQELERIAGEIAGESQQAKAEPSKSTQAKPQPSGGGIQGPESGAKERKPEEREASGNQPGKAPD